MVYAKAADTKVYYSFVYLRQIRDYRYIYFRYISINIFMILYLVLIYILLVYILLSQKK